MQDKFNLPSSPYFLSHSVGCLPKQSEQSFNDLYLQPWKTSGGDAWGNWLQIIQDFNQQLAILLGAKASHFCPQVNLSSGLTKFLTSLPKNKQKYKVIMHQDAFPSMGFVISGLQAIGLELVLVRSTDVNDIDAWCQCIDNQTLCVLITHVHSNTGQLSKVKELVELTKMHCCHSVVDIAQSAGVIPINLTDWNADVVLGSCVKWLCGGPGAGFMWINPLLIDSLNPSDVGWFSHSNPFEMQIENFEYHTSTQKFWGGTPNIMSYALALGSLDLINQLGVDTIFAHNKRLASRLLEQLFNTYTESIDLEKIGGSLCLTFSEPKLIHIEAALKNRGVFYDKRQNTLRLSFHIFNTLNEIDQLALCLRQ